MFLLKLRRLEEVPVKWIDGPSATEMERRRASEMDGRKSKKKHGNATDIGVIPCEKFKKIFLNIFRFFLLFFFTILVTTAAP